MLKKLLLGTTNIHKIKEFSSIFADAPFLITHPKNENINLKVNENGLSFSENALIKAKEFCKSSQLISIADDSGLEIDALRGRPGIYSARYGGKKLTDDDRVELVLKQLSGIPKTKRQARFRCAIAIAWPNGKTLIEEGTLEGMIEFKQKGYNGFGYDPIFYLQKYKKTVAELNPKEKNNISHRAIAAKKILLHLKT
ncbi:MAG: RdgB/HAM1 family non-canonical purine NTP pyrophosphatase [SAR202 cluster bacterium]|nr:RdgB/HAM1 family non-canonical purine NTP pyrophosphatase [SAR202 cluster bacterium]|tara:strand:+ start:44930 stop:45520 length:591 start_codon:yes stop_codon:yes gene_type:complete